VLNGDLARDPEFVSRFRQEAGVVNAVRHPNIIDVTDFIRLEEPPRMAYVMELLSGSSLAEALASGPLTPAQSLNASWQILDALEAVHAAGVVHRDLKPDNIFVVGDLSGDLSALPSIKILDFGIAKATDVTDHRTATGSVLGTPGYMAPEQAAGLAVTPAADVYAWASLAFEMLTGRALFEGSPVSILEAKLLGPVPKLDFGGDLDGAGEARAPLLELLRRCLATQPAHRPSASEAKDVLTRLGASTDGTARRTVVAYGDDLERLEVEVFDQARAGVDFARRLARDEALHVGIWTGSLYRDEAGVLAMSGPVQDGARQLMALGAPGRVLMDAATAELARQVFPPSRRSSTEHWISHGRYAFRSLPTPVELYEVLETSASPAPPPPATPEAWPVDGEDLAGWRPGPGLTIPQRPGWVLEQPLGQGGFGEVWLGRREGEARVFKFGYGAEAQRTLEREVHLGERLRLTLGDRSDLLPILGAELSTPPCFLESPYVPGGDLKSYLQRQSGSPRPPPGVTPDGLELLAQLAEAVAAAHSVGVLHRDLKPSNVLVDDRDPEQVRVVLADFGIGDLVEAPSGGSPDDPSAQSTGSLDTVVQGGTALYMSPERLAGGPASLQSDVYALGVILYQLLVGDLGRPITSEWAVDIEDELLRDDLTQMLAGNPRQRLADAGEVARRLRQLDSRREARAETARREAAAARARRFRRVALPIGALLLAFGVAMTVQARRIALEADRANRAAATASRVTEFLVDLFKVADPTQTNASEVSARELLDKGAARIQAELDADPLVRAELMQTIGEIYVNLGQYDSALELSREALELRRSEMAEADVTVADSLSKLGLAQRYKSRYEEAEANQRRALEIYRATVGEEHPKAAKTLGLLAQLTYLRGDVDGARRLYARSLEIREQVLGPDHLAVAESLTHLGWVDVELGRFREAEDRLQRALDIRRKRLGEENFLVAETLDFLSASLVSQGEYARAEQVARQVLRIREATLEPGHHRIATALVSLAYVLREGGDDAASAQSLERALPLLIAAVGPDHLDTGLARFELAWVYGRLERWEEAAANYQAAEPAYARAFGSDHAAMGELMNNWGWVLSDHLGKPAEAEPLLRRAVAILDTDEAATVWRGRSRASLANSLRDQGKDEEARRFYLSALELLRSAESEGEDLSEERA
ncbi:MAG: serine/threonine-protein kinase, partial [Myxococcota bacterium]